MIPAYGFTRPDTNVSRAWVPPLADLAAVSSQLRRVCHHRLLWRQSQASRAWDPRRCLNLWIRHRDDYGQHHADDTEQDVDDGDRN